MKKISIFAIAALATVGLSSCLKEKITVPADSTPGYKLTVGLANGKSRAQTAPGTAAAITLNDGHIYVFDSGASNAYVHDQAFTAAEALAGFEIGIDVPKTAVVYAIGNLTANGLTAPAGSSVTLEDVMEFEGAISDLVTTTVVPLATVKSAADKTFAAQAITEVTPPSASAAGEASAALFLAPVVARVELAKVEDHKDSDEDLTNGYTPETDVNTTASAIAYKVLGVYLTEYYPGYTMEGKSSGDIANFSTAMGATNYGDDLTATPISSVSGVAKPATGGYVWSYNIAAGTPARLVVVVQSTVAQDETIVEKDLNGDGDQIDASVLPERHLIVQSYKKDATTPITAFEPGVIYRVGAIPFDSAIFKEEPSDKYELDVTMTVVAWAEEEIIVDMNE